MTTRTASPVVASPRVEVRDQGVLQLRTRCSRTRPRGSTTGGGANGNTHEESAASPRLLRGEAGHATRRAGTRRPDRAPGLAPDPPVRGGRGGRPAGVGRPGGGALPCGARLGNQLACPYPPPARPWHPAVGGGRPAV